MILSIIAGISYLSIALKGALIAFGQASIVAMCLTLLAVICCIAYFELSYNWRNYTSTYKVIFSLVGLATIVWVLVYFFAENGFVRIGEGGGYIMLGIGFLLIFVNIIPAIMFFCKSYFVKKTALF